MTGIQDKYGRTFKTLRVSLLHHCNLGCVYCVAGEDELKLNNGAHDTGALSPSDLLQIIERLHRELAFHTIRLTGGEPLLYPDLPLLVKGIRSLGIDSIKLTTNGFLLERQAAALKQAGMEAINVSLDAIEEPVFFRMSKRHGVDRIIKGVDAAIAAGLSVKINSVIMKGLNDDQILPLLEFAFSRGIPIRFLEIMAMGHLHDQAGQFLFPGREILSVIGSRYRFTPVERVASATARYWQTDDGNRFGIIANETEPFCRDCDRLRLDSLGNIYGCLSSNHPIALRAADGEDRLREQLQEALLQKQEVRFVGSDLSMLYIGG